MIDNKKFILDMMKSRGREDALNLRMKASGMSGTEMIREETKIPVFDPTKDYSDWPSGAPVQDEGQVWTLVQPHNAKNYEGRPSTLRALWGLCHTKDADRAKPWVDPLGTSGMYMKDECYRDENGMVYRCLEDNTVHDAKAHRAGWEVCS